MNHVATIPKGQVRGYAGAEKHVPQMKALHSEISAIISSGAFTSPISMDPILDSAVDDIVENAKTETEAEKGIIELVLPEVVGPPVSLDSLVEFVPVKNGLGRYRFVSPALRQFIYESMDVACVEEKMIETPEDTAEDKQTRLRISLVNISRLYDYSQDFLEVTADDIALSKSGLTFPEYQAFVADFMARNEKFCHDRYEATKAIRDAHIARFHEGVVTWKDLTTGLHSVSLSSVPAANANPYVFKHEGQDVAGLVTGVRVEKGMMGEYANVYVRVYSHNGEGLNMATHTVTYQEFGDTLTTEELGLSKLVTGSSTEERLIARGLRYLELTAKPTYVKSSGNLTRKQGRNVYTFSATGRAVIDIAGMESIDTNYYQYFCKADDSADNILFKNASDLGNLVLASCVPYVYGFSFKSKLWGQMNVDQFSDIVFREDAYDNLVLDEGTKRMIFAMVTDVTAGTEADIIDGKGGGSINLLEGPPGVGKTLTAEAVAEVLKRPLYAVSVGELGTNVGALESNLKDILEIAAAWNAVLLIDEADIFLEARDEKDLERNAMVAVFLRLLEYYQGVMFLTTNRADNLDQAFESRITLCIHYKDLDYSSRKQVWTNLFKAAKIKDLKAIDALVSHKLNGRQIKHIIKAAGALARFDKREISYEDLGAVIQQKEDFRNSAVHKHEKGINGDADSKKLGWFKNLVAKVFG